MYVDITSTAKIQELSNLLTLLVMSQGVSVISNLPNLTRSQSTWLSKPVRLNMFMNVFTHRRRDPRKENLPKLTVNLQLNYWKQTYTFRHFLSVKTLVHRIDSLESCLALAIFRVQATEKRLSNRALIFTVNSHSARFSRKITKEISLKHLQPYSKC